MLDSFVFWQMAQLTRVLPSRSKFMFSVQDPTGAPPLHSLLYSELLVPVTSADAPGVHATIQKGLQYLSIHETVLKKNLGSCDFDRATVMMGKKSDVAKQLQEIAQYAICILDSVAHNLELDVNQS